MDFKKNIESILPVVKALRCKLHDNAEIGYNEFKTKEIITSFLNELGINNYPCTRTGVVGVLNNEAQCIAIRADMDALPINGVSHFCGHDYHMAVVLGCALVLKQINYNKCIKFIFQPAEENFGGALPMIEDGVLENPEVKSIIGFHVWPNIPVGSIEVSKGPSMASVDDFFIKFKGQGGHAAMPHLCKNPLYPALELIQTINNKSRIQTNPLSPNVITFSSIKCGDTPNVIADEALVMGTVRTFDEEVRKKIYNEIKNTSELCGKNYNCHVDLNYVFLYPPLINNYALTDDFINKTKKILGEKNVMPLEKTFASEDFSFFANKVPAVHFRLGISDNNYGKAPLHSPAFNASDECLLYGIYCIINFILNMD
ncbi:MAG: amidohydrolase [Clostridiaceae bacterium]|jgi:hippurate hydrolase|nr:amidohydrolase [Clostridiaceae bacterium]